MAITTSSGNTPPSTGAHTGRRTAPAAELCRLTILSEHSQVDLAVPLRVPLTLVIPGIVDTIVSHRGSNEFDDSAEQFEPVDWTVARVGRAPLSPTLSLHEHGIRDGDLLVLEAAEAAAPTPLFDDIMYTVAATGADEYQRWTPRIARIVGSATGILATILASLALVLGSTGLAGAGCALVASMVCAIASVVVARVYADGASAITLGCAAVPLALSAGILFVPGDVGSAHLLLGSALVAAATLLCLRLCGVGIAVFTALLGIAIASVAVCVVMTTLPDTAHETISAVAIAVALLLLTFTARLSMLFARLPLPPVPSSANPLDDGRDDVPEPELPGLSELSERATRARSYLTGLVVAISVIGLVAALALAVPQPDAEISWKHTALAGVTACVLMFRGRTFAGAHQAIPLITAGISIVVVFLARLAWAGPANALVVFGAAMVVFAAALLLGIIAPQRVFSPVMRRGAELVDLAAIASVVPLICWVSGLFSLMRQL